MTELQIILVLLGFSTMLQALTAGLVVTAIYRAKESEQHLAKQDEVAEKTLQTATSAKFAAAGILELDA